MRKLWNPDSSPIPCFLFLCPFPNRRFSPGRFFPALFSGAFFSRPICLSLFIRRRFFLRSVCPSPFFRRRFFLRSVCPSLFFAAAFFFGRLVRRLFSLSLSFCLPCFFLPWLFLFAGRRSCNFFPRCFCGTAGVVILSEPVLRGFFSAFSPPMLPNC